MIEKKNLLTTIVHFFPGSNTKNNESFLPGLSWLNKELIYFEQHCTKWENMHVSQIVYNYVIMPMFF